jgi:photosystem II stability/assembly factor-like uncharacterized protein
MKRFYVMGAVILTAGAAVLTGGMVKQRKAVNPVPTEIVREDESDNFLKRQEWIETLHRTAPGVDWRLMDEQTREQMYREKLPRLQEAAREGRNKSTAIESIADGYLTGQWFEKGSNNQAGRVHCVDVDFDNDRLYAAADGGQIWVGTMTGENWKSISDPYRIDNIQFIRAFNRIDGTTRILAAGNRVKMNYTDDMGTTWLTSEGLSAYNSGYELIRAVSQNDGTLYLLLYKSPYLFLFRSTDLGTSFTRMIRANGTGNADIWTDRFGKDSVYLLDNTSVYVMRDSANWAKIADVNINFSSSEIQRVQLAGSDIDGVTRLYAMYRLNSASKFFASDEGLTKLSYRGSSDQGPFMSNSFGASPTTPDLIGFGGVNAEWSADGGASWTTTNSWGEYYGNVQHRLHADIPEIEFFKMPEQGDLVYISTDGGTFYSDDEMQSVTNVSLKGLNISQYYSSYTNRTKTNVIYAGAQDQGFQKSWTGDDGIADFDQTISGDYGHVVSSDGGQSMWTDYPGFAMYYPDASNNNNMSSLGFDDMKMKNQYWMPPLLADPYFPNRVYLAGGTSTTGAHLWYLKYESGQVTATELPEDFSNGDPNTRIASMAYSPINKDYRYVLNSAGKFFVSTDRGTTWTQSTNRGPNSHYFYGNSIVPSPRDINTIWLAGSGYNGYPVWVSHDGGLTFQSMSKGMKNSLIFEMTCNEDGSMLFAASEVGPWVYIVAKDQWYDLSGLSAPQQTYWGVDYVPALRTARFCTYGRGIWDFKIATFSGIDEVVAGNRLNLSVYPNPFSDYLNISTSTLNESQTVIELFNLQGQLVRTLRPVNSSSVQVPVNDLPAGVYVLTVSDGKVKEARRVVKE